MFHLFVIMHCFPVHGNSFSSSCVCCLSTLLAFSMLWFDLFSWVATGWYLPGLIMELWRGELPLPCWMTKGSCACLAEVESVLRRLQKHMTKASVKRAKEANPEATNTLTKRFRDEGEGSATVTVSSSLSGLPWSRIWTWNCRKMFNDCFVEFF